LSAVKVECECLHTAVCVLLPGYSDTTTIQMIPIVTRFSHSPLRHLLFLVHWDCSEHIPAQRLYRSITWMVGHASHHVICHLHLQPKHIIAWVAAWLPTHEGWKAGLA